MKNKLGVYRFLPLFFFTGAAIELFMIKVRVGNETFCEYFSFSVLRSISILNISLTF